MGTGSVDATSPGIDCPGDCSEDYPDGLFVILNTYPGPNSVFAGWSGDADCADGGVTMADDTQCTATFEIESHLLNVTKTGTGSGTLTSIPAGIDCGSTCSHSFVHGTVVTPRRNRSRIGLFGLERKRGLLGRPGDRCWSHLMHRHL